MKNILTLSTFAFVALAANLSQAADLDKFDGIWQTTVSCKSSRGALGYSYQFDGEVKDGAYHGLHGIPGKPGSLDIKGKIAADGSAKLYAKGCTGSKEFVPGREMPTGTEYGYSIDARFDDDKGSGKRIEGRPCNLEFKKE